MSWDCGRRIASTVMVFECLGTSQIGFYLNCLSQRIDLRLASMSGLRDYERIMLGGRPRTARWLKQRSFLRGYFPGNLRRQTNMRQARPPTLAAQFVTLLLNHGLALVTEQEYEHTSYSC